jgi:hypothetical protein
MGLATFSVNTREAYRSYNIQFSHTVTDPVRVAVAPNAGSPNYQTLRGADGSNAGGRYNTATGNIEARIHQSGTFTVIENRVDFTDIQNRSAAMQAAILQLAAHGIMQGATPTEFHPDDPMTRAQVAATVVRMLSIYDYQASNNFTDVRPADWFYSVVSTASQAGLIGGTSATAFSPHANMIREQLLSLSARVLRNEMGYSYPRQPEMFLSEFSDWENISTWSREGVALSIRENIPQRRTDNRLLPTEDITRGEAALIFHRLYQLLW